MNKGTIVAIVIGVIIIIGLVIWYVMGSSASSYNGNANAYPTSSDQGSGVAATTTVNLGY